MIYQSVDPYTMVSNRGTVLTYRSVQYLERQGIEGDVVECGVWRGGQIMTAYKACQTPRHFWLYDTFEGMTEPGPQDIRKGTHASDMGKWRKHVKLKNWCRADLEEVEQNLLTVMPKHTFSLIKGPVETTLQQGPLPKKIGLLRLDTDWYSSTMAELQVLYPLVSPGGVVIFDDYHSWDGARQAVDEFFGRLGLSVDTTDVAFHIKP